MAYSAITFSGSTNGRPMAIDAVASPGTTIHTIATATAAAWRSTLDSPGAQASPR